MAKRRESGGGWFSDLFAPSDLFKPSSREEPMPLQDQCWSCSTTFETPPPFEFFCYADVDEPRVDVVVDVAPTLELTEAQENAAANKALGEGQRYEPWRRSPSGDAAAARVAAPSRAGRFLKSKRFENGMLVLILINCALLAMRDGGAPLWWKAADLAILGAFVLEAIAKIATFRLRYFYSAWNVLDAVVALTGVVDAAYMDAPDVSFLKALRVLRPLRTVNRVPRLQRTIAVLLRSLINLRDIVLMIAGVLLTLSLAAMQLWSPTPVTRCVSDLDGSPQYGDELSAGLEISQVACWLNDDAVAPGGTARTCGLPRLVVDGYACEAGYSCARARAASADGPGRGYAGFRNVLTTVLTLTNLAFGEIWSDIMLHTQEANGAAAAFCVLIGGGDLFVVAGSGVSAFFVCFMLAVSTMLFSIAVAALLSQFHEYGDTREDIKAVLDGELAPAEEPERRGGGLDDDDKFVPEDMSLRVQRPQTLGDRLWRGTRSSRVRRLLTSPTRWPNVLVTLVVLLSVAAMAADGYHATKSVSRFANVVNLWSSIFFAVEFAAKVAILGVGPYFGDAWNWFDFVICVCSVVEIFVESMLRSVKALRILRLVRLARRLVRAVRHWNSLREVLLMIEVALDAVWPSLLLLLLFLFIMTLGAMQFFGPYGLVATSPNDAEHERAVRFDSFTWAFLQVFLTALGEDWSYVMYSTMAKCGEESAAFFVTIAVVGRLVLANVVLACLLDESTTLYLDVLDQRKKLRMIYYVLVVRRRLNRAFFLLRLHARVAEAPGLALAAARAVEETKDGDAPREPRLNKKRRSSTRKARASASASAVHVELVHQLNGSKNQLNVKGRKNFAVPPQKKNARMSFFLPEPAREKRVRIPKKKQRSEESWARFFEHLVESKAFRDAVASSVVTCGVPLCDAYAGPDARPGWAILDAAAGLVFVAECACRAAHAYHRERRHLDANRRRPEDKLHSSQQNGLSEDQSATLHGFIHDEEEGERRGRGWKIDDRLRRAARGAAIGLERAVVFAGIVGLILDPGNRVFFVLRSLRCLVLVRELKTVRLLAVSVISCVPTLGARSFR
ncbi:hypothetical protein JL721_6576 [Aureococcus anophagefferens]|nr:hypothetical protein JL721_6576 [Aureococcus anophagefferens]